MGRGQKEGAARARATVRPATLHHGGHGGHGGRAVQGFASASSVSSVVERLHRLDWPSIESSLDAPGFAKLPAILAPDECESLATLYQNDTLFRSRIDMARFRFGAGEYKYFTAPLPPIVQTLREDLYARLSPIANRWMARLKPATVRQKPDTTREKAAAAYPATLDAFLRKCHAAGQTRPTPLLLSYVAGGYNCLHQDIYGDLAFPLQVVFVLSRHGVDYTGGEFLLVEQRPRAQSRGHAIAVEQGRRRHLRDARAPGGRHTRHVSCRHAPRRQHAHVRPPNVTWHHLS